VDANLNLRVYSAPEVVDHFVKAEGLFPAERYLFAKFVRRETEVLDVGVGGGRTTGYLASRAKRYLGVDYSDAMIGECRKRFPRHKFMVADATNLATIADDSFDLTLFSFNGIDCIPADNERIACLAELRRVTRPAGRIIISSHNARVVGVWPALEGADLPRTVWRIVRAGMLSVRLSIRMLLSSAFWRGSGFIMDPVHGGLRVHVSTPASIARDCAAAGLVIVEQIGHFHPKRVPGWLNPWTNYVLARRP
jgi:SAM-dependent methyltransferase